MKEYFYAVALLSLLCSLGVFICKGSMRPALRSSLSLLIIAFALRPVLGLITDEEFGDIPLPEVGELQDTEYFKACEEAFCRGAEQWIAGELGISEEGVEVKCRGFSLSELKARELYITLLGEGIRIDRERVGRLARDLMLEGGEVSVEYGIG